MAAKPVILVINDTQEILDLFREILEEEGCEVHLSSFSTQQIDTITQLHPDLVILDLIFEREYVGWQTLQKMKMRRETATIPVIVCTAEVKKVQEIEGYLAEKGVGLVLKPFDIDDLTSQVRRLLASGPLSPLDAATREPLKKSGKDGA